VSTAEGIEYLTSSIQSSARHPNIRLNYDPNTALTDVIPRSSRFNSSCRRGQHPVI